MKLFCKTIFLSIVAVFFTFNLHSTIANAQVKPLTYPEIITALNTKLPNTAFKDKSSLINFLITQIGQRKVEKNLSAEMETTLRESGATEDLIRTIKANVPSSVKSNPTQSFTKNYLEMSDSEKKQFIESKAYEFLNKFGRTETDKISPEGIGLIKSSLESYVKRLSVDEKTLGNADGMISKNTCNYGKGNLTNVFRRGRTYIPDIMTSFVGSGIYPEIGVYVGFIESEFCPCIQAPTGPLGMFQFTYAVASIYGINAVKGATPDKPDERCTPKIAAGGAAKYFKQLTEKFYGKDFDGIIFSIAAYNSGEGSLNLNIRKIRELKGGASKINFWDLVANKSQLTQQFQNENYLYVPRFIAAAIIGENPKSFGLVEFQPLSSDKPQAEKKAGKKS